MTDWIATILATIGTAFACVAAIGIARMPDLYTRMHATAKSATLGVGCILLAVTIHFDDPGVTARTLLIIAFLLMTAPIATHYISRAAYLIGISQWSGTVVDELRRRSGEPLPEEGTIAADAADPEDPAPHAE